MKLKTIPITLEQANQFIFEYHRHCGPKTRYKFAIGAIKDNKLVGVGVAGRPTARLLSDQKILEITRVCTDGTRNVNSFLYSVIVKIARLMGYEKVITYTLTKESQSSLKAIGAKIETIISPKSWDTPSRRRVFHGVYKEEKIRWRL